MFATRRRSRWWLMKHAGRNKRSALRRPRGFQLVDCRNKARSGAIKRLRPTGWGQLGPTSVTSANFLGNAAPGLLDSSPFLFFLCASSIGASRAFFEAIGAFGQIVPRLALVFRFFPGSRLAQVFSGLFPRF